MGLSVTNIVAYYDTELIKKLYNIGPNVLQTLPWLETLDSGESELKW